MLVEAPHATFELFDNNSSVILTLSPAKTVVLYQFEHTARRKGRVIKAYHSYVMVIPTEHMVETDKQLSGVADLTRRQQQVLVGQFGLSIEHASQVIRAATPELAIEAARVAEAAYRITQDGWATVNVLQRSISGGMRGQIATLQRNIGYRPGFDVKAQQLLQIVHGGMTYAQLKWPS